MGLALIDIIVILGIAAIVGYAISRGAKFRSKREEFNAELTRKQIELELTREQRLQHRQHLIEKAINEDNREALALLAEKEKEPS